MASFFYKLNLKTNKSRKGKS